MIRIGVDSVLELPFGRMITARWIYVFLNGRNVTERCFEGFTPKWPFIPGYGEVGLYQLDEVGKRFLNINRQMATEHKKGIVFWIPRKILKVLDDRSEDA